MTGAGLLVTGISIIRDARAQARATTNNIEQLPVAPESEKLAA